MTTKCRLWKTPEKDMEEIAKVDLKYTNYTHAAINAMPISTTDELKRMRVDDVNFVDEDIFLIETEKNKKFVFTQLDGDDEESKASIAN